MNDECTAMDLAGLPAGWQNIQLGDAAVKVGSGITPTGGERVYRHEGRPFVRSQNVGWGTLDLSEIAFIDEATHQSFPGTELLVDDVLLNITGASIGRSALVDRRTAGGNVNQHVCIIRVDAQRLDAQFLNHFLLSSSGQAQVDGFQAGGNRQGLNFAQIRSFVVPAPPPPEQRAIAAALSDVDALLAKLDQLIAKKRDLKQAAMQQLLTGQTRLPGFSGDWGRGRLGDVASLSPGINKPVSEMGSGALYVTVQDLYKGTSIPFEELGRIRVSAVEIQTSALRVGDIVFGKSSVKREGIGYPSIFLGAPEPAVCTGFAYRARANPEFVDPRYLFYALRWDSTRRWIIDNSQASALTNINKKIADSIPVPLPTVDEQTAIATLLSDIDAELTALTARRDKTRALKQGMAQALLTGRIRLV